MALAFLLLMSVDVMTKEPRIFILIHSGVFFSAFDGKVQSRSDQCMFLVLGFGGGGGSGITNFSVFERLMWRLYAERRFCVVVS